MKCLKNSLELSQLSASGEMDPWLSFVEDWFHFHARTKAAVGVLVMLVPHATGSTIQIAVETATEKSIVVITSIAAKTPWQ